MSFRKRNTVISAPAASPQAFTRAERQSAPGTRPSPLDGRLTTSTGTASLDTLLAGHAGLPLGSSILIEEQGTTDFAGVLLKYYAAEGLVQGHHVHVLGYGSNWKHELPAISTGKTSSNLSRRTDSAPEDKMKIAWRYETLGNRTAPNASLPIREKEGTSTDVFCHQFDLSKRLSPSSIKGTLTASPSSAPLGSNFEPSKAASLLKSFIKSVQTNLASSPPGSIHRVVVPSFLSPTLYGGGSCCPSEVLQFLHSLRGLLRQHSGQLTAMLSLPTSLYPRHTGLTRWIELLCDGTVELIPLPSGPPSASVPKPGSKETDRAQGMVKVYALPIYHEKGGGGAEGNYFRENLSFLLSGSRGLVIQPYSLPPLEEEDNKEQSPASTVKDGIDF